MVYGGFFLSVPYIHRFGLNKFRVHTVIILECFGHLICFKLLENYYFV